MHSMLEKWAVNIDKSVICDMSIVVIACFTEWATIAFARSNML
jgi:hypothetical protein